MINSSATLFHNYGVFYQHVKTSVTLPTWLSRYTLSMILPNTKTLSVLAISIFLVACSSGPFKWNQSTQPAAVQENPNLPQPKASAFTVLVVPSGAIRTQYISDKTATAAGVLGSMVVGPIAGAIGGLVGSTASSAAASSAEEKASSTVDSSDVVQAVAPIQLQQFFASTLAKKLNRCGIQTAIHPALLNGDKSNWQTTHLVLPPDFQREASPYRFFVESGMVGLQVRAALADTTIEGNAYARVYETQTLRQIGRYASKTGSSGSVTLDAYGSKDTPEKVSELQKASQQVAQYLASDIATDMCTIMRRF